MTRIVIAAKRGQFWPVDACVFGEWAAHPSHLDEPTWCVTHVPTGRRVHSEVVLDKRTAMAIAEALSLEIPAGAVPVILPTDKNPKMPPRRGAAHQRDVLSRAEIVRRILVGD